MPLAFLRAKRQCNKNKQALTDLPRIKLIQHYCSHTPVKKHLWPLMGWGLTSNLVWAVSVDLCTKNVHIHPLPVPVSCFGAVSYLLTHYKTQTCRRVMPLKSMPGWSKLAAEIHLMGIWQHACVIHTCRCCQLRGDSVHGCSLWARVCGRYKS